MVSTIDIVIPSFRFDINQINSIINLKYPEDISVNITVIVDNPAIKSRNNCHNERVNIIYNKINIVPLLLLDKVEILKISYFPVLCQLF